MTANYADGASLSKRNLTSQKSVRHDVDLETEYVWKRNPSWPVIDGENANTFIGSWAIRPNIDNIVCFTSRYDTQVVVKVGGTVSNTYNFTSAGVGSDFQFTIDYNNSDFDDTDAPITLANTTNLITRTDHGYVDDDEIEFFNLSAGTNLNEKQIYYVVNASTSTFQVSETEGGSAVDINDGTGNLLPYKVCTIEISGDQGDPLGEINIQPDPTSDYDLPGGTLPSGFHSGWLEIHIDSPDLEWLEFGQTSSSSPIDTAHSLLENVVIWRSSLLDFAFAACRALKNLEFYYNTSNATNTSQLSYALAYCSSLRRVYFGPSFQWGTVDFGQFSYFFLDNVSLTDIIGLKLGDITPSGSALYLEGFFNNCHSLRKLEHDIFEGATTSAALSMFYNCYSLEEIPSGLDTSNAANFSTMFYGCRSLKRAPVLDTSSGLYFTSMFRDCSNLTKVPAYDTSSATSLNYFFYICSSLIEIPSSIVVPSGTNTNAMFGFCHSLKRIPDTIDFSNSTNMNLCFSSCYSLEYVPPFDIVDIDATSCFSSCYNLRELESKTAPWEPSDATRMFQNCYELTTIPQLDLANAPDMDYAFNNCIRLKKIPEFLNNNTVNWANAFNGSGIEKAPKIPSTITACTGMFRYCESLRFVPDYDISGATNHSYMFQECKALEQVGDLITNTTTLTTVASMFQDCFSLRKIGAIDLSSASLTSTSNLFNDAPLMDVTGFIGPDISFDMSDCHLNSDQLDELYTNLPSTSSATLTVTGQYGYAGSNTAIATAKGWTVSG
jgi:hypothetical protein